MDSQPAKSELTHINNLEMLMTNLKINKRQNDIDNFVKNIFNYLNYIYVNIPDLQKVIIEYLTHHNLLFITHNNKLTNDLLQLTKHHKGGNIDKNMRIKEAQYIRKGIKDKKKDSVKKKVRALLEKLFEIKRNNINYHDDAKYQDLIYMDSITFIDISKKFYKENPENYNKLFGKFQNLHILKTWDGKNDMEYFNDHLIEYEPDFSNYKKIIDLILPLGWIEKINSDDGIETVLYYKNKDGPIEENPPNGTIEVDAQIIIDKLNSKYAHDEQKETNDNDKDERWSQIYRYTKFKEYLEHIPYYIRDLDDSCCCNQSKYFDNIDLLSDKGISQISYENEIDFLKKFIYNTDAEIFMTIFDIEKRNRCNKCNCCREKKHNIKITQLYNLIKGCIIYEKHVNNDILEEYSEKNISEIFLKENNKFTCDSCSFKTIYEYIIENLLQFKKNENTMSELDEIEHYKYIANIRDYIINNFETNLFPIFHDIYCPDLFVKNFNPNLFFFDFEIDKIISCIHNGQPLNECRLETYYDNYIIRDEIGQNDLKCIIEISRKFLKDSYVLEKKMNQIITKKNKLEKFQSFLAVIPKILGLGASILKLLGKDKMAANLIGAVGALAGFKEMSNIIKLNSDEIKLLKNMEKYTNQKNYLYKNLIWDESVFITNNEFINDYLKSNTNLSSSKQIIQKLIPENHQNFDFNNICRYVYYLAYAMNFNREIDEDSDVYFSASSDYTQDEPVLEQIDSIPQVKYKETSLTDWLNYGKKFHNLDAGNKYRSHKSTKNYSKSKRNNKKKSLRPKYLSLKMNKNKSKRNK